MHGIAMAKTYTEIHPDVIILFVDSAQSIGGSWALERLYPRLKTNNVLGSYEFSDFPMTPECYSAEPRTHIPGRVVYEYLNDVADHYNFKRRCRLGTYVQSASFRDDGTWLVELSMTKSITETTTFVVTKNLVIATGLTSEPNIPTFAGKECFGGPVIHSKQLKEKATEMASYKNVVVVGANKSAWDVCYDAAQHGSQVTMIIRPSGGGPSYVWPKAFKWGLLRMSLAGLSSTRFFMAFDPTLYSSKGPLAWWSHFLHGTSIGKRLCNYFWNALDRKIKSINGYKSHPELAKLEPWTTPFWMGNSLSIHNYETDWFQLVREGKIKIRIAEIDCLQTNKVILKDGAQLDAEVLVCCTGWKSKPIVRFHDGFTSLTAATGAVQRDIERAKSQISNHLDYLKIQQKRLVNAPKLETGNRELSFAASEQLYRFMIPWHPTYLQHRNLAYIGAHSSIHAVLVAQVQALWITAYFDDKIEGLDRTKLDPEAIRYDTILNGVYGMLRRPKECGGAADKHADLVLDSVPYMDCLLDDLCLKVNRKTRLWSTAFGSHKPRDYKGLVKEYKARTSVKAFSI
jgi:cation diffusion facilitator CzcD-associated flavoprotein CzcO